VIQKQISSGKIFLRQQGPFSELSQIRTECGGINVREQCCVRFRMVLAPIRTPALCVYASRAAFASSTSTWRVWLAGPGFCVKYQHFACMACWAWLLRQVPVLGVYGLLGLAFASSTSTSRVWLAGPGFCVKYQHFACMPNLNPLRPTERVGALLCSSQLRNRFGLLRVCSSRHVVTTPMACEIAVGWARTL
jgi:hypothetical protein